MSFDQDVEKSDDKKRTSIVNGFEEDSEHAVHAETFEVGDTMYAKLQRFAGKLNIEQRGIERVPDNEKTDTHLYKTGTMWLAANLVVSSFAIGVLGPQLFFLGWYDSVLTIIFFNLLSIMPVAFFSTFGAHFGLRQMILSRFYFGPWGVRVIAFLNCIACIGWSSVNVMVGAQLIHTVNHSVPEYAGIIIIAVVTFIITCFGYKIVHMYEFWSWIPCFIVFLITTIQFARSGAFVNIPASSGKLEAGNVLSFGGAIFGFGTGWTSYAADYTVYQPRDSSKKLVFLWTWLGLIVPLLFTEILGAAIYMGVNSTQTKFADGYNADKIGGLFGAVLVVDSLGNFGNFCLVILALSIIGNNCPNIYSIGLSVQVLSSYLQRVPRFIWTGIATCCYIAIAIPGASHFSEFLSNFMLLIAYWLGIYQGVSLTDHFVFRRGFSGYDGADFDQPEKLPPGIAAGTAFCAGVAGAVLGMSQYYYVGVIAMLCGEAPYGGDVGFELAFAFTTVTYLCLRPIEKWYFKR